MKKHFKGLLATALVSAFVLGGGYTFAHASATDSSSQSSVVSSSDSSTASQSSKASSEESSKSSSESSKTTKTKKKVHKHHAKEYQNPKGYYQIQSKQIKPVGQVGYTVKQGYEGIKTYKIMKKLGTFNGYNNFNAATTAAVKQVQAKHHLKQTGDVDEKTWVAIGLPKSQFYSIDEYVAPLGAKITQGRKAHIEAAIKQAYKYLGNPYLVGASTSPEYGNDCSGLVTQALYAGGISPVPVSSIQHAFPGNEWNSRRLWASKHFKHVPYSDRQRGDLIFYYQPGTHTIWHVALYLGHDRVIESWPPKVMISGIVNAQRSDIAGVVRPWLEK